MSNNTGADDPIEVWQSQPVEPLMMSMEEIRKRAKKFQRRIRWRNIRETVAAAAVIVVFTLYFFWYPALLQRIGSLLIIAGNLYIVYRMNGAGASSRVPEDAGFNDCLTFHRNELIRQRDMLRTVTTWYLAPLAPGLAVFLIGSMAKAKGSGVWFKVLPFLVVCGLGLWLVPRLNNRAADCLQRQIDELDRAVQQ